MHHRIEEFCWWWAPWARAVCVLFALGSSNAESVSSDGCAGAVSVLYLLCVIYIILFCYYQFITHREESFQMGLLSRESHNIQTYYRAGLIDSGVVIWRADHRGVQWIEADRGDDGDQYWREMLSSKDMTKEMI